MPLKKLTPEEQASTAALLAAIERKDRRFRIFQSLFMVVTFIALAIVIGAQQRTLSEIHEQQKASEQASKETSKRSEERQNKIIRRLNCMVVFFSEKDRSRLSIEDIDRCTLNRDQDIQQFFRQPEPTPSEQPPVLPSQPEPVVTPQTARPQPTTPRESTTSAPPPPARERSLIRRLPLVGGLLSLVGV